MYSNPSLHFRSHSCAQPASAAPSSVQVGNYSPAGLTLLLHLTSTWLLQQTHWSIRWVTTCLLSLNSSGLLVFILQRLQQALDPLARRLTSPLLAAFDPGDLQGQEEGGQAPGCSTSCSSFESSRCVCSRLLQEPRALLTQGHEALQLGGVHVLADVQRGFERVLDVQRRHLRLALLLTLETGGWGRGEQCVSGSSSSSSYKRRPVCTVCSGPSILLVMVYLGHPLHGRADGRAWLWKTFPLESWKRRRL